MEMAKPSSETSSRKNALNASSRTAKWMEERSGGNSSKCGAGASGPLARNHSAATSPLKAEIAAMPKQKPFASRSRRRNNNPPPVPIPYPQRENTSSMAGVKFIRSYRRPAPRVGPGREANLGPRWLRRSPERWIGSRSWCGKELCHRVSPGLLQHGRGEKSKPY